ncbi:MAG TPA: glycosyltransferase [Gemmataceae bacterium]|nr:glycosyltransferase [Gemmataceae bacterium]
MARVENESLPATANPRKLLFLADCHLRDALWPPFHQNLMRALTAAFDVLAVRTNVFFLDRSQIPRSDGDLASFCQVARDYRPDVVLSINRAGLGASAHEAFGAAGVVTMFIDLFERFEPAVHQYRPGEYVWLLGNEKLRARFLNCYGSRLPADHIVASHWCADDHAFIPTGVPRAKDVVYVGSPFSSIPFAEILNAVASDPVNRAALLAVYEEHKRDFLYDWPASLRRHGFRFDRVPADAAPWFRDGFYLQTAACDQLTAEARFRFLAALAGLDLHVYGTPTLKWLHNMGLVNSDLFRHYQFRGVDDPAELSGLYNSARIGVNLQHDSARGHGMSFRVYEVMACKALLVTHADATVPLTEMGFTEGADFVAFTGPAELRRKCDYYLARDAERQAIVESANAKLRGRHTVAHRLAELFGRSGDQSARERFLASTATGPGSFVGRIRHVPDRISDLPAAGGTPNPVDALKAEIEAIRSSWALRIGTWMTAPVRPVKRLLRRAG